MPIQKDRKLGSSTLFTNHSGGAAGSISAWATTGATSGAITAGATTVLNGGSVSESITAAVIGGATGLVAGAAGHRIAIGSALAATQRGAGLTSSVARGDSVGRLGSALMGIGAGSGVNAIRNK